MMCFFGCVCLYYCVNFMGESINFFLVFCCIESVFFLDWFKVVVVYMIGYVVVMVSMLKVVVLFMYIIKSGELVFSVFVLSFFLGEIFFVLVYFFFILIIGGCVFFVFIEFNFNMIGNMYIFSYLYVMFCFCNCCWLWLKWFMFLGFMGVMMLNLVFVFCNIFLKKGMKGKFVSGMNYYVCFFMLLFLIFIFFVIVVEGF